MVKLQDTRRCRKEVCKHPIEISNITCKLFLTELNYTSMDIDALPSLISTVACLEICYNETLYMFPEQFDTGSLDLFPVIWIEFVEKHYTCFEYFKQVLSR